MFRYPSGDFGSQVVRHFEIHLPAMMPVPMGYTVGTEILSETSSVLASVSTPAMVTTSSLPYYACDVAGPNPPPQLYDREVLYFPDSPIPVGDPPGPTHRSLLHAVAGAARRISGCNSRLDGVPHINSSAANAGWRWPCCADCDRGHGDQEPRRAAFSQPPAARLAAGVRSLRKSSRPCS